MTFNERVLALAERTNTEADIFGLVDDRFESSLIVGQLINSCAYGLKQGRAEAFSFKSSSLTQVHSDRHNAQALRWLVATGWVVEESRPGYHDKDCVRDENGDAVVLVPTEHLLDSLEHHLDRREQRNG